MRSPSARCWTTVVARLGAGAAVHWVADADHSFHVPARTGRKDPQVRA